MRPRTWLAGLLLALLVVPLLVVPVAAAPTEAACGPNVTHLVQPGENLFRISLRYGTTMQAVAAANGIWNYTLIYAGSVLRIPCAGAAPVQPPPVQPPVQPPVFSGPGILPPVYSIPTVRIPPIVLDCRLLAGTSPLDGMAYGEQTFYWNPVPGATSYRVNVYNLDINPGRLVAVFDTAATRTSLTGNIGGPAGPGFRFQWEVQALVSDIPICTSRRYTNWRSAAP